MTHPSHVTLDKLRVDDANVRKTGRGAAPMFIASIAEKGLIEPLIVRADGGDTYTIINGSKRFDALVFLRDEQRDANGVRVTDTYPVPVIIRKEDSASALETSLTTAVVHAALHPVDEYEAFAALTGKPANLTVPAIALRFGITEAHVHRAIALGKKLSPEIREAWRKGEIDDEDAKAFTLAPDFKAQNALLKRMQGQQHGFDRDDIHRALKIDGSIGRMLEFVGIDEYERRGGKATRDLFGINHQVADAKLLKAMVGEKMETMREEFTSANTVTGGWAWAMVVKDQHGIGMHEYGRIAPKTLSTAAENRKLRELANMSDNFEDEAAADQAQLDHDKLQNEILLRSFTPELRAKSGVIMAFGYRGLEISYGRTKPEEKRKVDAQVRATDRKKKTASKVKAGEPVGVSNALMQRMSEQLTKAAHATLAADTDLALPAILAGFAAGEVVVVEERGLPTKQGPYGGRKTSKFDTAFKQFLAMSGPEAMKALAAIAGRAIDMQVHHADHAPLKNQGNVALIGAMKPSAFNKAMREAFDYKDYFDSVSKPMVLAAITEAVNADEARKVSGKPKADVAKFANANVPKTGWLPPELRTVHYDGPTAKAKASVTPIKAKPAAKGKKAARAKVKRAA